MRNPFLADRDDGCRGREMKFLPLIWSGLRRKPVRTILSFLCVFTAFLLFGLLNGVTAGFDHAMDHYTSATRLRTQNRVNIMTWLPLAYLQTIENIPGVTGVAYNVVFGAYFQDPRNSISAVAMDPDRLSTMYPNVILPRAQRLAFSRDRLGAVIGADLAKERGWKIGDHVPLKSELWVQKNGSNAWDFDIVGIYKFPPDAFPANSEFWINYNYFDEARAFANGMITMFFVNINDAANAARIANNIDGKFANSPYQTETENEDAFFHSQINRIGDISLIVDAMIGAVMFTLLFLTANTMMQSVRERGSEFAVLKTYGFGNTTIWALVLAEAALLCVSAAILGLALAAATFPSIYARLGVAAIPLAPTVIVSGIAIALLMAVVSALLPLVRFRRLQIVDALAGR